MERITVIFTFAIFALCLGSDDPFANFLPKVEPCYQNCSKIYQPSGLDTECERGCRLHSISELLSLDQNVTVVKTDCYNACTEAYGEANSRLTACENGCDIQQKTYITNLAEEKAIDKGPSTHLLRPLMQVHAVYSSLVGAVQVIRSSLITYFISDDNTILAVESEPEVILGINPEINSIDATGEDDGLLQAQQKQPRLFTVEDEDTEEPSIVKCMSRKIGVPSYILAASLVALLVFTLYIVRAMCNANSTSKAKALPNSKTTEIDAMPVHVKLVRPEDLTKLSFTDEDDLQAPALPMKVKMPDTMI